MRKELKKRGIYTVVHIINGLPGETKEDIKELKEFIEEYHFNHLGVFLV